MREIEIKVRVADKTKVSANLEKLGIKLGPEEKQHDVVYGVKRAGKFIHGDNWLRVRTVDDKTHYFTLKRSVTGQMDSIERETTVGNPEEMTKIITDLGFEQYSDLTKIRREGKFGKINICFDEVPELGAFLEAELISPEDSDYDNVSSELWKFLSQLGFRKSDEITDGYDVMLNKKLGWDF